MITSNAQFFYASGLKTFLDMLLNFKTKVLAYGLFCPAVFVGDEGKKRAERVLHCNIESVEPDCRRK